MAKVTFSNDLSSHSLTRSSVFRVPTTHDVLTLFNPAYPKSHFDMLSLALLGSQILLYLIFPRHVSQVFFLLYFAFWRAAYDAGLGWVLTKQSKKKWIEKQVQKFGWLDEKQRPKVRNWVRAQLAGKMGKDYSFDVCVCAYSRLDLFNFLSLGTSHAIQYLATLPSSRRYYLVKVWLSHIIASCANRPSSFLQ